MRIAILSDIHANIYALEAAIGYLKKEHIDSYVFLGDLVFLGLYPQECFQLLMTLPSFVLLKGNTDINIEEYPTFTPKNEQEKIVHAITGYAFNKIDYKCKNTIKSWSHIEYKKLNNFNILFCHGSPFSPNEKLIKGYQNLNLLKEKVLQDKIHYIFCGHTHKPNIFSINPTQILNFGAIGFSLNGITDAFFGILNVSKDITFKFKRIDYNKEKYKKDIQNQKPVFMDKLLYFINNGLPFKSD